MKMAQRARTTLVFLLFLAPAAARGQTIEKITPFLRHDEVRVQVTVKIGFRVEETE